MPFSHTAIAELKLELRDRQEMKKNEFDDNEDDARLNNYLKISMGRRNALPPPPGDMMALLAQHAG